MLVCPIKQLLLFFDSTLTCFFIFNCSHHQQVGCHQDMTDLFIPVCGLQLDPQPQVFIQDKPRPLSDQGSHLRPCHTHLYQSLYHSQRVIQ